MFRHIFDFSMRRSALQAVGWYIVWSVLGLACAMVSGFAVGVILSIVGRYNDFFVTNSHLISIKCGQILAVILVAGLGAGLLAKRALAPLNVVLFLVAVLISLLLAGPGGLIPLAVLTTRPPRGAQNQAAT